MEQFNSAIDRRKQALLLCQQGEFTQAREMLVELERAQELDADACLLMGSLLGQLEEYDEALGYFQGAIDIAPDQIICLYRVSTTTGRCHPYFIMPAKRSIATM